MEKPRDRVAGAARVRWECRALPGRMRDHESRCDERCPPADGHGPTHARAFAVVEPLGYDSQGKRQYRHVTFRQLDQDSDRIARGLREWGVPAGTRLALLVRPGIDFISLRFRCSRPARWPS